MFLENPVLKKYKKLGCKMFLDRYALSCIVPINTFAFVGSKINAYTYVDDQVCL